MAVTVNDKSISEVSVDLADISRWTVDSVEVFSSKPQPLELITAVGTFVKSFNNNTISMQVPVGYSSGFKGYNQSISLNTAVKLKGSPNTMYRVNFKVPGKKTFIVLSNLTVRIAFINDVHDAYICDETVHPLQYEDHIVNLTTNEQGEINYTIVAYYTLITENGTLLLTDKYRDIWTIIIEEVLN